MPLPSFLDDNRGNILVTLSCHAVVNVFLFQFKVHLCSVCFFFSFSETQESPQFSLGFRDKETKVRWVFGS